MKNLMKFTAWQDWICLAIWGVFAGAMCVLSVVNKIYLNG